jgi:hypothetical protein
MKGSTHIQIKITLENVRLNHNETKVMNVTLTSPVSFLIYLEKSDKKKSSVLTLSFDDISQGHKDVCIMIVVQVKK